MTCVARLGLKPRLITKVADDAQGKGIIDELKADGVDTSFMVVILAQFALFIQLLLLYFVCFLSLI